MPNEFSSIEKPTADQRADFGERGRFSENPCPTHLNDGVNVLVCPICAALQLAAYMDKIVRAKDR